MRFSYFLRLLFVFKKIFLSNDGQINKGEKKYSREDESPMGLHCFKKHVLHGNGKEKQRNFSIVKEYGRHEISRIQVFTFVSVCVVVFLTSIFLFKRAFYYFIRRYIFVDAYPFKNNCQMEIFITVYLPKQCLLNKLSLLSVKCQKL